MQNFLYMLPVLSLSLGMNNLLSAEGAPSPISSTTYEKSAVTKNQDQSQQTADMIESAQVAKDYVNGLDQQEYAQSWTKGDPLFQRTISQIEWAKALSESRKRLGKVQSRKLKDQRPAWDPHGLPKGAYMVVEYDTSFENAPSSGELLTLRKGADHKWRILTYQVN